MGGKVYLALATAGRNFKKSGSLYILESPYVK